MLPGRLAGFVHDLEHLPILDRVHHGEEAVVRIRDQLAPGDQAREGLLDELVAGLDEVDDLATEDEEAAVDADGGPAHVLDRDDVPLGVGRNEMRVELRRYTEELRRLAASVEG